jgi:hypothetical protein
MADTGAHRGYIISRAGSKAELLKPQQIQTSTW